MTQLLSCYLNSTSKIKVDSVEFVYIYMYKHFGAIERFIM